MTIEVEEWYDGDGQLNLTITWDSKDPVESRFNNWTAVDFLTAIKDACDKELPMGGMPRTENSERLHPSPKDQEDVS